ncbi:MAG TPA: GNAT family N-acetyltransferase [Terracidiphilus sp.]
MTEYVGDKSARCFLRPALPEDEPFLFQLFAESQQHLAAFQSNAELYNSLIEFQFRGRKHSYLKEFPRAVDAILCLEDEARGTLPIGRILVDCAPECWRIVDIAVLAAHRRNGFGSWAIQLCQRQSDAAGARLTLAVRPENTARRLYERLGFRVTEQNALTVEMELAGSNEAHSSRRDMLTSAQ